MSSQYSSFPAENCIDGDFYSACVTYGGKDRWLSVELLATAATVTGVEVYNPRYTTYQTTEARYSGPAGDYYTPALLATIQGRLGDFEVWVGSSSGQ